MSAPYTQKELATVLGVDPRTVRRWERLGLLKSRRVSALDLLRWEKRNPNHPVVRATQRKLGKFWGNVPRTIHPCLQQARTRTAPLVAFSRSVDPLGALEEFGGDRAMKAPTIREAVEAAERGFENETGAPPKQLSDRLPARRRGRQTLLRLMRARCRLGEGASDRDVARAAGVSLSTLRHYRCGVRGHRGYLGLV